MIALEGQPVVAIFTLQIAHDTAQDGETGLLLFSCTGRECLLAWKLLCLSV